MGREEHSIGNWIESGEELSDLNSNQNKTWDSNEIVEKSAELNVQSNFVKSEQLVKEKSEKAFPTKAYEFLDEMSEAWIDAVVVNLEDSDSEINMNKIDTKSNLNLT